MLEEICKNVSNPAETQTTNQRKLPEPRITRINFTSTNRCNLRCKMCDFVELAKNAVELSLDEIKKMIDDACTVGLQEFEISGGEPMVRKDIYDIISYCMSEKKLKQVTMMTNGVLIGEDEAKKLADVGLRVAVVSLEGPEEINDSIRGKGTFQKAVKGIKNLLKYKRADGSGPYIGVGITLSKMNYQYVPDFVEYLYEEIGVDFVTINPYSDGLVEMNKKDSSNQIFSIDENTILEIEKVIEKILGFIKNKPWGKTMQAVSYLEKIPAFFRGEKMIPVNGCYEPLKSVAMETSGYITPCWGDLCFVESVRIMPINEIIKTKKWNEFALRASKGDCAGCLSACYQKIYS